MAVSASSARVVSQFFFRLCRLYLRPLSNSLISLAVNFILVLFTTLA